MAKFPMRVLVGSKLPTGRASGITTVRPANVRLSSGRFWISRGVTTPEMSDLVVSMTASAATSTVSVSCPSANAKLKLGRVPTLTSTSLRTALRKPCSSADSV
jgi:hypothetical protein